MVWSGFAGLAWTLSCAASSRGLLALRAPATVRVWTRWGRGVPALRRVRFVATLDAHELTGHLPAGGDQTRLLELVALLLPQRPRQDDKSTYKTLRRRARRGREQTHFPRRAPIRRLDSALTLRPLRFKSQSRFQGKILRPRKRLCLTRRDWLHPNARKRFRKVQTLLEVRIYLAQPAPVDPPRHLRCAH